MLLDEAKAKNIISADEYTIVKQTEKAREDAIQVDDFDEETYRSTSI